MASGQVKHTKGEEAPRMAGLSDASSKAAAQAVDAVLGTSAAAGDDALKGARAARKTCTCTDTDCPAHPTNHLMGCTPCIIKNLQEREVPSCLFHAVGRSPRAEAWTVEDFALSVVDAQRAAGEADIVARKDAQAASSSSLSSDDAVGSSKG